MIVSILPLIHSEKKNLEKRENIKTYVKMPGRNLC